MRRVGIRVTHTHIQGHTHTHLYFANLLHTHSQMDHIFALHTPNCLPHPHPYPHPQPHTQGCIYRKRDDVSPSRTTYTKPLTRTRPQSHPHPHPYSHSQPRKQGLIYRKRDNTSHTRNTQTTRKHIARSFLDGYCSTVQGLLDWFDIDLGFTELLFIQINLCVLCVFLLQPHANTSHTRKTHTKPPASTHLHSHPHPHPYKQSQPPTQGLVTGKDQLNISAFFVYFF